MLSQVRKLILFRIFLSIHWFALRAKDREIIFGPCFTLSISTTVDRPNFSKAVYHGTLVHTFLNTED